MASVTSACPAKAENCSSSQRYALRVPSDESPASQSLIALPTLGIKPSSAMAPGRMIVRSFILGRFPLLGLDMIAEHRLHQVRELAIFTRRNLFEFSSKLSVHPDRNCMHLGHARNVAHRS